MSTKVTTDKEVLAARTAARIAKKKTRTAARMAKRKEELRLLPSKIERIPVDEIHVGERMRPVSPEKVATLAASMKEIGLRTPISARYFEEYEIDGNKMFGVTILGAGAHRLAAAKLLGQEEIDVVYLDMDDIAAQLWEIDENLARAELTADEKRKHLLRRKELWEQRKAGSGLPSLGGRGNTGFAAETAKATGLSKRRINQILEEPKPKPRPKPVAEAPTPGPKPAPADERQTDIEDFVGVAASPATPTTEIPPFLDRRTPAAPPAAAPEHPPKWDIDSARIRLIEAIDNEFKVFGADIRNDASTICSVLRNLAGAPPFAEAVVLATVPWTGRFGGDPPDDDEAQLLARTKTYR